MAPGKACPYCGSRQYRIIKRRKLLTALARCERCHLRFRFPLETPEFNKDFYQTDYQYLHATDVPDPARLEKLVADKFRGSSMEISRFIQVLGALGVPHGARLLEFGSSWGYGPWQLREAGYDVVGYEVSRLRAGYGRTNLGVDVRDNLETIQGPFDVFFSSHVIEHLPTPAVAFDAASRLLAKGGLFVAFTPNGSEAFLQANPSEYHRYWNSVHPLYLDGEFYGRALTRGPKLMCSAQYERPYDLAAVAGWDRRSDRMLDLSGEELCLAAVFDGQALAEGRK